jgi:hypothetical protein
MRSALPVLVLAVVVWTCSALAQSSSSLEARKIEHLIAAVAQLSDAKFVRNGAAYDAGKAADHLRLKLREAGERVATAEDFIRLCASRSSVSGKPYEIEFADGRRITSEAFLRAKLEELRSSYQH